MSQYSKKYLCGLNTFYTYIPVPSSGSAGFIITDPSNVLTAVNGFLQDTTGKITLRPTAATSGVVTITETITSSAPNIGTNILINANLNRANSTLNYLTGQTIVEDVLAQEPFYFARNSVPATYTLYTADVTGGLYPVTYSAQLPPGITINSVNGALSSAVPLTIGSLWPLTNYQVQVSSAVSTYYASFKLSVDIAPVFSYPNNPYVFTWGDPVQIMPTILVAGTGTFYQLDRTGAGLPAGLVLSSSNGQVTGTVLSNARLATVTYTVLAYPANGGLFVSADVTININIPGSVAYAPTRYNLVQGVAVTIVPTGSVPAPAPINDTWQATAALPNGVPANTSRYSTAYAVGPNKLLMFNLTGTYLYDVNTNNCALINTATTPPILLGGAIAFVSHLNKFYMFGGTIAGAGGYSQAVWSYDLSNNNWQVIAPSLQTDSRPVARAWARLGYNPAPAAQCLVIFGGQGPSNEIFADTWQYNIASNFWQQIINTNGDQLQGDYDYANNMVYHPGSGLLVMYNSNSTQDTGSTYSYSVVTQRWYGLQGGSNLPSRRRDMQLAYDSVNDAFWLYGGQEIDTTGLYLNDTWTLTLASNGLPGKWTLVIPTLKPTLTQQYPHLFYNTTTGLYLLNQGQSLAPSSWTLTRLPVAPAPQVAHDVLYTALGTRGTVLPYGLQLNGLTGVISGVPTVLGPADRYTVTATTGLGFGTSAVLTLQIVRPYLGGNTFTPITELGQQIRYKYEVLQYRNNQNKQSRAQQWAAAVNGSVRRRVWASQSTTVTQPNTQNLPLVGNVLQCVSSTVTCTLTSAADVPGPIMQLCVDSNWPPVNLTPNRVYTLNGTKWPQES